jgi:hypothetical protein
MPRLHYLVLVFTATLAGAPTTPDCASCHPSESHAHARTRHAIAMVPALQSAFADGLPDHPLGESEGGYAFIYRRVEKHILVAAVRGNSAASGLIEWVIGAGQQGQTPLVRTAQGIRESRVSYFPKLHRYGITVGQEAGSSPNAEAALGLLETPDNLEKCLGCHSTTTRNLESVTPGVQCSRCHPGAIKHAGGGNLPMNPGKMSAEDQVRVCGECHRIKPPGQDSDPDNVRFQPLRLMKSRCYKSKVLRCTSCHPAHQDARRDDAENYNAKCRGCHSAETVHAGESQKRNCIGCHMPQVELHPALKFTDHFIRVVAAREP